MLTKDETIFDLAKKSFTAWADALDPAKQGALWTKPTWVNVSKGTRKRFVREARASITAIRESAIKEAEGIRTLQALQATQEPQEAPAIVETPTAPITYTEEDYKAAEASAEKLRKEGFEAFAMPVDAMNEILANPELQKTMQQLKATEAV